MSDRLIIFTRYPEPGKTKTRLIPALGPEGAAALQRRMTEHTLAQGQRLQQTQPLSIEIRFTGGDRRLMRSWLGRGLNYQSQGGGNLGQRMSRAFQLAFQSGNQRVVIIGIDCPDLNTQVLEAAFQALHDHDLVLGPATDGGYYLIGLSRFVPELFKRITWSTDKVLRQTLDIATYLDLSVAQLQPLDDIDRPEDLPIWERVSRSSISAIGAETISVIIPVLNEVAHSQRLEQSLLASVITTAQQASAEVIVVDGGSQDDTVELACSLGARVIASEPGRAKQMNAGADVATGDILLFLHGDTQLPDQWDAWVRRSLSSPGVSAGAFRLNIDGSEPGLRLVETLVNWRSRWLQMPYGDQAIFLWADQFRTLGGFPDLPIMEDFEMMLRLRRQGAIALLPTAVVTSGRRWKKLGILQTTLLNQIVILGYFFGISPQRLARWYHRR